MKNAKTILLTDSAIAFVALVVSIPRIKEYKIYKKVDSYFGCDSYLYEYPDGHYVEEVKELKEELLFSELQTTRQMTDAERYCQEFPNGKHIEEVRYMCIDLCSDPGAKLSAINDYLYHHPQGAQASNVDVICNQLWDDEIKKFDEKNKHKSTQSVKFMREMLLYMRDKHINKIQYKVNPTIQLKDYSDYGASVRNYIEDNYIWELPPQTNIASLKDNFSENDLSEYDNIIIQGINEGLNELFTPGFITVCDSADLGDDFPLMTIDYTIKNQEYSYGGMTGPDIWTWSEGYTSSFMSVKGYLLGIDIRFNGIISIPESNSTYKFAEKGSPKDHFSSVQSISSGYSSMTSSCFDDFARKIAANLGL